MAEGQYIKESPVWPVVLIGSRGTGRDPGQDGMVFSRSEATLYERLSVRPSVSLSVHMYVMLMLFGLLGATYAVSSQGSVISILRAGTGRVHEITNTDGP